VQPVRVLQYTYGGRQVTGIGNYIRELYRALDRTQVQFDFLYRYQAPAPADDELAQTGSMIRALDIDEGAHPIKRQLQEGVRLTRFLREHRGRYDAIEIQMAAVFMCLQATLIARVFGISVRIVHSHDAVLHEHRAKRLLKAVGKRLLDHTATHFWASDPQAGRYLFTRRRLDSGDWLWVKNGIDTERFAHDRRQRTRVRTQLGLTDQLTVGVVGRFSRQKNQTFALRVFGALLETRPDAHLVLVGDGPSAHDLEQQAARLLPPRTVSFLGSRGDVSDLMQAFDVLLAPSLHEGFALIALEAQSAGLPTVASTAFPRELQITGTIRFVDLRAPLEAWSSQIIAASGERRVSGAAAVAASGFDSRSTGKTMGRLYVEAVNDAASRRPRGRT